MYKLCVMRSHSTEAEGSREEEREKNRPLLLESKLQHLYPSDKIFHQILVTSALSLQKGNLCLHTTEGERGRERLNNTHSILRRRSECIHCGTDGHLSPVRGVPEAQPSRPPRPLYPSRSGSTRVSRSGGRLVWYSWPSDCREGERPAWSRRLPSSCPIRASRSPHPRPYLSSLVFLALPGE